MPRAGWARPWSASTCPTWRRRTVSPSVAGSAPRVGVVALQGDVREHRAVLRELGADAVTVRRPEELETVSGLVIPGGESSVIDKLSRSFRVADPCAAASRAACRCTARAPG